MQTKAKRTGRDVGQGVGSARRACISASILVALGLTSFTANAQSVSAGGEAMVPQSTVVTMITMLVKQGALTQDNANELISQLNQAQRMSSSTAPLHGTGSVVNAPTQSGDIAVPYVPQIVQDQIRDQVKQQVIAQAKAEKWAEPNTFPDWVSRITINGDVRVRDEYHFYSSSNATAFTNFAAINAGSPYDINRNTSTTLPPILNSTRDRTNIERYRARFGIVATISDTITAGIQLASGNDSGPVTTTANAGGGFAKKSIWLNKVYLAYQPKPWLKITGGRFDNPFFASDLLFSNDLEMDGVAANLQHALPSAPDLTVFGTLGVFPIQYTSESFPSNSVTKGASNTHSMAGAQLGAQWNIDSQNRLKGSIAYYDYQNLRGTLSQPCALYLGETICSTDNQAPAFMQGGNTLIALRDVEANPNLAPGMTPQPQLFGLAFNYRLLDGKLQWDTMVADWMKLRLDGEYVRNLAYNKSQAFTAPSLPVNNYASDSVNLTSSDFKSGPTGYMTKVTLGEPDPTNVGDWNVSVTYKYLQPDATLDAFNDPDFHMGGTNARGYILGAAYAVAHNAWLSARYLSAKQVYGPPFAIDVLQLEVNARF